MRWKGEPDQTSTTNKRTTKRASDEGQRFCGDTFPETRFGSVLLRLKQPMDSHNMRPSSVNIRGQRLTDQAER